MTEARLGIGIPTYFRSADVMRLVEGLRRAAPELPVTVIDDGPDPATQQALAAYEPGLTLIGHPQNRGYAQSFVELLESCDTDYLLISADDDLCDPDGLQQAQSQLETLRPDFAAPRFFDAAGRQKRGRSEAAPMGLTDIRDASGHASGLIYRTEAARAALPFLRDRLEQGCYAARLYPQTLLVYVMALRGARCLWLPAAPIREGAAHPAQLSDTDGTAYNSPAARLREQEAFDRAFAAMATAIPAEAHGRLEAVARLHEQELYRRFMLALRLHHPGLVQGWISGSLFYCRNSLPRLLLNLWYWWRRRRADQKTLRVSTSDSLPPQT